MVDKDFEHDVKEYKPRKKNQKRLSSTNNYNISPMAGAGLLRKGDGTDVNDNDNSLMLSTSEILDFSEGTDSWVNNT